MYVLAAAILLNVVMALGAHTGVCLDPLACTRVFPRALHPLGYERADDRAMVRIVTAPKAEGVILAAADRRHFREQ